MTRRATVLQPDGMLRDKNPANRAALRKHFADDKWRTVHDIGVTLHARGVIPDCVAIRAMARSPEVRRRPIADQIRAGCSFLVRETLSTAVTAGVFESRGEGDEREYRCVQAARSHPRVGSELSEAELKAAAAATLCGISYAHVYLLIKENPQIEPKDLIPHLLFGLIDEAILASYTADRIRRIIDKAKKKKKKRVAKERQDDVDKAMAGNPVKRKAAEKQVAKERQDDEDRFLFEARLYAVNTVVNGLISSKKVKAVVTRTLSVVEK